MYYSWQCQCWTKKRVRFICFCRLFTSIILYGFCFVTLCTEFKSGNYLGEKCEFKNVWHALMCVRRTTSYYHCIRFWHYLMLASAESVVFWFGLLTLTPRTSKESEWSERPMFWMSWSRNLFIKTLNKWPHHFNNNNKDWPKVTKGHSKKFFNINYYE